jgi:hypothetical protein
MELIALMCGAAYAGESINAGIQGEEAMLYG